MLPLGWLRENLRCFLSLVYPVLRCVIYWRYHLDKCRVFVTTQRFPRFVAFAFKTFMPGAIREKATMQGMGKHTPEEVFRIAEDTCQLLDDYLGN